MTKAIFSAIAFVLFTLLVAGCSRDAKQTTRRADTECAPTEDSWGIFAPCAGPVPPPGSVNAPPPPAAKAANSKQGGGGASWWQRWQARPILGLLPRSLGTLGSVGVFTLLMLASWGLWIALAAIPNLRLLLVVQRVLQLSAPLLAALAIGNLLGHTMAGLLLGLSCTLLTPLWPHRRGQGGDVPAPTTAWPVVPNWLRYVGGIVSFLVGTGLCF